MRNAECEVGGKYQFTATGGYIPPRKLLIVNDVAGVAPLLQAMLHLKCLIVNDVADVAPF
jgi:hypothetical protein